MMNSLSYLSPYYRDHPDAVAFCEVLDKYLPEGAADMRDYAWSAPIPPRDQWEREAMDLAQHLENL